MAREYLRTLVHGSVIHKDTQARSEVGFGSRTLGECYCLSYVSTVDVEYSKHFNNVHLLLNLQNVELSTGVTFLQNAETHS